MKAPQGAFLCLLQCLPHALLFPWLNVSRTHLVDIINPVVYCPIVAPALNWGNMYQLLGNVYQILLIQMIGSANCIDKVVFQHCLQEATRMVTPNDIVLQSISSVFGHFIMFPIQPIISCFVVHVMTISVQKVQQPCHQ